MADVNAEIGVNIDTTAALAQLKSLQRQISQFHTSIARSSDTAALAQKSLQKNFLNSVNAIGSFSAELRTVKTTTESFTSSLEGNKFSMREYFRYAGGATKTFGRLFKSEFDTIGRVAEERVKRLQTQYIKMGRDASGAMQAISITPTSLDMQNYGTKTAIAAQKQALFNQLMKQGSTNLLNFGKNTQWAGRQLMVGFTIPLAMVGTAATKTFMEMEAQAIKFKKVYGDLFTPAEETQQALDGIVELGKSFTKYGIAVSDTVGLAAEAAAAGFSGLDLQRQTTEASRLSVLGQIDNQKALETTISLQNAFGMSSDKLADSINFLNAVENQTVVSLDDITTAIPKVAPVIQQLGGDVKDLTFFIAAMKEGGINASEGANALKSGLAALINPTGRASAMLKSFGINATEIVTKNKGNLKATVVEFATALNQLDPLNRAQAIEQMFGKFQFARLSTLFSNVAKDGNQAARVLDLANTSVEELSALSEQELGMTADSAMNKFKKTVEDLKIALVPVGKAFLEAVTPIVEFVGNILEKFGNLSDGTKKAITLMVTVIGGLGPILLMTFGLLANGVANIIKLFLTLRNGYLRLTGQSQVLGEQTQYLTMEQIDAAAASHSLNQAHATLTQQFTVESGAVMKLKAAYEQATAAGAKFALNNPGSMLPRSKGYANGVVSVPGSGKGDTVPAMLTPGEAVIPAAMAKKYAPLIQGMISGNIPGYQEGVTSVAERFITNRVGRSASGGERAQVNVPGGYQLGHFAEPIQVTGAQLQALVATQAQSVRKAVEALINSVGGNLEAIFDVFTNQVTVQSKELNQALGEAGSGKVAPVKMFRQESVGGAGAYNAPLIREMQKAGATTEEVEVAVKQLAEEFASGIEELGEVTTVTAEEVNNITQAAYDKVASVNEKVRIAQQELQKPGAIKEVSGVTTGRVSFAGGYNTSTVKKGISDVVQQQAPGAYPTQQAFNFTGDAARKVGVQNARAMKLIFDQLEKEAKERIFALLGDIDAMSQQVVIEAQNAGIDIGKYAVLGVAEGAETESPSKKTIKTGEDVGKGLEIGIKSRQDEVARAGEAIGEVATQSTARGARRVATRPQGAVGEVAGNVPVSPDIKQKVIEQAKVTQTATDRLKSLDRTVMGASFAISSLSGLASMSGGKLGEMSGVISKVTGVLFALQAVTSLLTQAKLLELAATRANTVAQGMGAVNFKSLLTGVVGFGKKLFTAGKFLARFAGLPGMVISGVLMTASLFKLSNDAREREYKAINGLADAMKTTTDQVKTLGDFFGIVPSKLPIELGKGREIVAPQIRSQREALRADSGFQKQYGETIKTLSTATAKEAELAFTSLALNLKAQGFASDQVQTIIDALREEAGKTDVVLDVKSLNLSTESLDKLKTDIAPMIISLNKELEKGQKQTARSLSTGELVSWVNISKKAQKELATLSSFMSESAKSAAGMFQLGLIDATSYTNTLNSVIGMTNGLDEANRKLLLTKVFESLQEGAGALIVNLKSARQETMALALLSSGVLDKDSPIFKALGSKDAKTRGRAVGKLTQKYNELNDAVTKATGGTKTDPFVAPETSDTGEKKLTLADMIKKNKEFVTNINNQKTALNRLTAAGMSVADAMEIVTDAEMAAVIAGTDIKKSSKEWKKYVESIKNANKALLATKEGAKDAFDAASSQASEYFSAQEALITSQRQAGADLIQARIDTAQTEIDKAQSEIDKQQKLIDVNSDDINEINRDIEIDYERPIQALNDEASILQNNLTLIDKQSEAINKKYDAQEAALTKIAEINSEITGQQKQQLGLADALSSGDIAAAADAVQEMRASAAAGAQGRQSGLLESARAEELSRVSVGGMTREQIDKELFRIGQETFALEQLRKKEQERIVKLQDDSYNYELKINRIKKESLVPQQTELKNATDALELYTKATASLISSHTYLGLTSKEWENNKIKVDAAYTSIKATETSLGNSKTAAKTLFDLWDSIKSKTITLTTGYASTGPLGGLGAGVVGGVKYNTKMYGGKIMPMNYGGMVPKYMARGGAVGSDTVPAMLTPGEFIMNKGATKRFGPMLEAMNNSKYPSMIKDLTPTNYTTVNSSVAMPVSSNLSATISDNSSTMYNYTVAINVNESNASSGDIARAVMTQIKYIDSQRIRGQR